MFQQDLDKRRDLGRRFPPAVKGGEKIRALFDRGRFIEQETAGELDVLAGQFRAALGMGREFGEFHFQRMKPQRLLIGQ